MKKFSKIVLYFLCVNLFLLFSITSSAHPGRTDSSGGHHDYKNRSGLGSYHYHHGMGPHLHPGGICPYAPKDSIKITSYPKTINVGDSCNIEFKVNSYYNDFSYKISSSDSSVLKVNYDNSISGVGAGKANITIKTSHAETTISVTVKEVFAKELNIKINSNELQIGNTIKIHSTFSPKNTTNKELTYSSSDEYIATVSSDGTITGISSGTTTITVTTSNNISQSIDINVFEVFPEEIQVDCDDLINLIVGDIYNFNVYILPDNANNKAFSITCENEEYVAYTDFTLSAIKEGDTILHIETWNGTKKDIIIHVDFIPVEKIEIKDETQYIYQNVIDKYDEILLTPLIAPSNATYQDVIWESSDNDIVSIENDKFIINGTGKVTLTCIAHGNITNYIEITIIDMTLIITIFLLIVSASGAVIFYVVKMKNHKKQKIS